MDVTSVPPPIIVNNTLPQDIAAKAVPNAQAMVPLVQNAVDPAPKTEKFNAARRDKKKLREICVAAGMDLAGKIEEHLVIKQDSILLGGAMLAQSDHDVFHLLLIAVDATCRSNGAGSQLLQEMLRDPWKCCRDALDGSGKGYRVTTIARGMAAGFITSTVLNAATSQSWPILFATSVGLATSATIAVPSLCASRPHDAEAASGVKEKCDEGDGVHNSWQQRRDGGPGLLLRLLRMP